MQIIVGITLGWGLKSVVDDGNFWWFEWLLLWKLQR